MEKPESILPHLPENLKNLHKEEERIRVESLLAINADSASKDHLHMIEASLDTIHAFTILHEKPSRDELTIQLLGIRLFNAGASALALLLAGYYQNSVMLQRDLLETGFLVDYLTTHRAKIQEWRESNDKERENKFSQRKIREALDAHDNATGKRRAFIYKLMCKYGAHPSYEAFRLVSPNGISQIGPFFEPKFLKHLLEELVKNLTYFALVHSGHFSGVPIGLLSGKAAFLEELRVWAGKYLGPELGHIVYWQCRGEGRQP
jgi:hypothetical protein